MKINKFISGNYNRLNAITKRTISGYSDDIFHDTLIKVIELFNDREVDDEIASYIVTAMRNNVNRYRHYAYNEKKIDAFETLVEIVGSETKMERFDFESIMESVELKFGKDTRDMIMMFLEGYSVGEIQDKYKINNFYYVLRKVKYHIVGHYKDVC